MPVDTSHWFFIWHNFLVCGTRFIHDFITLGGILKICIWTFTCQLYCVFSLQVLSLKLYKLNKNDKSSETCKEKEKGDMPAQPPKQEAESATEATAASSDVTSQDPYEGLDESTRECFKVRGNSG